MKKRNWMYRLSSKSMSVMAALALMVTTMATNRSCMWYLGTGQDAGRFQKLRRF
ncbi:MAG: cyclic lactone autoinducer peptide [Roseburia hominis]